MYCPDDTSGVEPRHRDRLQTGDLVFFSGKSHSSTLVKLSTSSHWSHVAMVYRDGDRVLLWEAATLRNIPDYDSGKVVRGVRLACLSDYLNQYDGDIAVRHLDVERTDEMLQAFAVFREQVRGRPYEKDLLEKVLAACDFLWCENVEDLSSFFCSELVAETYQRMGLLSEDKPSNEYTPHDFTSDAAVPLPLFKGTLGPEVMLSREGL